MHIQIAERLKPYSHIPGEIFCLPGTFFRCQIFPILIKIDSLETSMPVFFAQLRIEIKGPVEDFTAEQNLERGSIQVWGHSREGYFLYSIIPSLESISSHILLHIKKAPIAGLIINSIRYQAGDTLLITPTHIEKKTSDLLVSMPSERLSLGLHKAQDMSMIRRRCDLAEILPLWFRLGVSFAKDSTLIYDTTTSLMGECRRLIMEKDRLKVLQGFKNLFLAGFDGMLSPRTIDTQYQGFSFPPLDSSDNFSPLVLLTEGAHLIRSMFIQSNENKIKILPVLPVEFHCGRLVNIRIEGIGEIDLEWSKKRIRRLVLRAKYNSKAQLVFKDVKKFRIRQHKQDLGKKISDEEPIYLAENTEYFLDNFMH